MSVFRAAFDGIEECTVLLSFLLLGADIFGS